MQLRAVRLAGLLHCRLPVHVRLRCHHAAAALIDCSPPSHQPPPVSHCRSANALRLADVMLERFRANAAANVSLDDQVTFVK